MEHLQQLILNVLAQDGSIVDSRNLTDPNNGQQFKTAESQVALQAALSSLESRNVGPSSLLS